MSLLNKFRKRNYFHYPYQIRLVIDLPDEIWKSVTDYEDYYEVSNYGRIKSIARDVPTGHNAMYTMFKPERILSQQHTKGKSLYINLAVNHINKGFLIRNLVYVAFNGEVDLSKYKITHIDGDSENCTADNLSIMGRRIKDRKRQARMERLEKQKLLRAERPDPKIINRMHIEAARKEKSDNDIDMKLQCIGLTNKQKHLLDNNGYAFRNLSLEDMNGEIWLKLPLYEELIEVSNMGRVKRLTKTIDNNGSLYDSYEKIAKQNLRIYKLSKGVEIRLSFQIKIANKVQEKNQYKRFTITTAKAIYSAFVERLTYSDICPKVIFKDNDPLNVSLENLQLFSGLKRSKAHKEKSATKNRLSNSPNKETRRTDHSIKKEISRFDREGNYISTFQGIAIAARNLNCSASSISKALDKLSIAKGFFWRSGNDKTPISMAELEQYRKKGGFGKVIEQYTSEGEYVATHQSISKAAKRINCSTSLIKTALSGKIKYAKSWLFKEVELV